MLNSIVRTEDGDTLAHTAIRRGVEEHVETLAAQQRCDCWSLTNRRGDTPLMFALKEGKTDIVKILAKYPQVDLDVVDEDLQHLEDIARYLKAFLCL